MALTAALRAECVTPGCVSTCLKARGMCRRHYEAWRESPESAAVKITKSTYPSDDDLVVMFREYGSHGAVAELIGIRRESLRDYLTRRPELWARCKAELPPRLTGEQRLANLKASRRQWRLNHPDRVKAGKRRWASGRDPETVQGWNRHNAQRRAESLAVRPLTAAEALESHEYEQVILGDPCVYCGRRPVTVDHIQSVYAGGTDLWDNKAPACQSCNSSKREKDVLQFMLWRQNRAG